MQNRKNGNVEEYFKKNHATYNINTDRHRILSSSQLFGLLTKTPPYSKAGRYGIEEPTEIFELLKQYKIGSHEYNTLKSEQILKVKIKAIIDTAGNNDNWNILPVIYIYKVLKVLKEQYQINSVDIDRFYTYIMTSDDYSCLDETVFCIKEGAPITEYIDNYRNLSRVKPLVHKNINLFNFDSNNISINEKFDEYFNNLFMEKFDIDELNIQLKRVVDYTYFLTSCQNFNINLIDEPNYTNTHSKEGVQSQKIKKKKTISLEDGGIEDDDVDYVIKVNDIKEFTINPNIVKDAEKVEPTITSGAIAKRYSKNPLIGKVAIQNCEYLCQNDQMHTTFIANSTKKPYMEAHHLIPISAQLEIWIQFGVNIDCIENIVSLCPNCHRAIHYAKDEFKIELLKKIFETKKDCLASIGLNIDFDFLLKYYIK